MPQFFIAHEQNKDTPSYNLLCIVLVFQFYRSFRLEAKCLEQVVGKRSHIAITKWVQKYSEYPNMFRIDKHEVKQIFVDETLIQIDGQNYWLWAAYEPNLSIYLMMHMSIKRERTIFCLLPVLKAITQQLWRKETIFADGALWYDTACKCGC